ncbi:DNA-binding transcriptional regulator, LysR family [Enhydrobacter aerosaccus]|uniref:DNA-binding transcriptional regulator, LysR family n=1 Tax=Enhydrobacter aerosaccus TaxID=225324 RepID=A0A1T4KB04_9HYPH|nr:LysR family transcriptional regulator [Enhydrobacter aerosaccus]SJZ39591.1 DNA-binding transcriptional regulator, LysR family [Enhydrobacter aerosaccus]
MNWRRLDLNLLVVFDAVMQERSATRAAEKLNMSQPAVSHALARLRTALRDDLFVRTPEGMEPTPQAERLAPSVRQALADLRAALDGARDFEPAEVERRFVVSVNNYAALVIAPALAATVSREAPFVTLDLRPSGTINIAEQLDRGDIDLALGSLAAPAERFSDLRLFEDRFACVLRRDHPLLRSRKTIDVPSLATLPHLELSSTGDGTKFIDDELARFGLERRIALRAPLLSTAGILAQSDMVAVMAERAALVFADRVPLEVVALPFTSPRLTVAMLWHRRVDDQPAHSWLRSLVTRLSRSL